MLHVLGFVMEILHYLSSREKETEVYIKKSLLTFIVLRLDSIASPLESLKQFN